MKNVTLPSAFQCRFGSKDRHICHGPVPAGELPLHLCRLMSGTVVGSLSVYEPVRLKLIRVRNSGLSTPAVSVMLTPPPVTFVMIAVRYGAGEFGIVTRDDVVEGDGQRTGGR